MLWLSWFAANVTVSMGEVASAWLMTSLTDDALTVALVQTAAQLPVFILGLPSGALADIMDRRRYMAATLLWGAAVSTALWLMVASDSLTAPMLLALTFATGVGVATRWPVFIAIIPDVVGKAQLRSAIGLNAIAMHFSRLVGPVAAGLLLASAGAEYVFMANAVLSVFAFLLVMRCRLTPIVSDLPGEQIIGAMRVGLVHVLASSAMRVVLARTFLFFFQVTALTALLPLIARAYPGDGIGSFTAMLAAMGAGAIICIFALPYLHAFMARDRLVYWGTGIHAVASVAVVFAPNFWLALPAMVVVGIAWIGVANSLTVAAQMALPAWVRARGMSFVQIAMMGGMASGAALWGYVANLSSVAGSVIAAAAVGPLALLVMHRLGLHSVDDEDLTPIKKGAGLTPPVLDIPFDEGPLIVTIEYTIDPARADDFRAVMKETRSARLRQGTLTWRLYRDIAAPGRYIEYMVNENWGAHNRLLERFTSSDERLRERRLAFHIGDTPPRIQRYLQC